MTDQQLERLIDYGRMLAHQQERRGWWLQTYDLLNGEGKMHADIEIRNCTAAIEQIAVHMRQVLG